MITLTSGTRALAPNITTQFLATGGTAPYLFNVVDGGAGGTINPTTGLYTAPAIVNEDPAKNTDTIQVTDNVGGVRTAKVLIGSALLLFCDIIQTEMDLKPGRVYLWDQKINLPDDDGIVVIVSVLNPKAFGNSTVQDGSGSGLKTIQSVNMLAALSVDILSRGPGARDRKEEILMAVKSNYAQQQMATNSFKVSELSSSFLNLSHIDGAAIPYRFNITVNMYYTVTKVKDVKYYDTFLKPGIQTEP